MIFNSNFTKRKEGCGVMVWDGDENFGLNPVDFCS